MQRPLQTALIWACLAALPGTVQAQGAVVPTLDSAAVTAEVAETPTEVTTEVPTETPIETPVEDTADGLDAPDTLRVLDAAEVMVADFLWTARIIAVLADTPNDPAFVQQMRDLLARAGELLERDVVVITDTDPAGRSDLRLMLRPRGFMLAIIEKDGAVAQRRPAPRDVREIMAIIDRFPLRRQEMLERRPSGR